MLNTGNKQKISIFNAGLPEIACFVKHTISIYKEMCHSLMLSLRIFAVFQVAPPLPSLSVMTSLQRCVLRWTSQSVPRLLTPSGPRETVWRPATCVPEEVAQPWQLLHVSFNESYLSQSLPFYKGDLLRGQAWRQRHKIIYHNFAVGIKRFFRTFNDINLSV